MLRWAIAFLILAIIAALVGLFGVAGVASQLAWIVFAFGVILAILFAVAGRQRPL